MHRPVHQISYSSRGYGGKLWIIIGLILVFLHLLPWLTPNFLHIMIMTYLYAAMGQGWNVLGGYVGQYSFGHAIFFGTGAYVSTLLFIRLGLSPWLGLLFSCSAGIILGAFIGFLSFHYRLKGPFFALIMLAFAEIFHMIAMGWEAVGKAVGLVIPMKGSSLIAMQFIDSRPFYFITLWMMVGYTYLVWRMERLRTGFYFLAVREDQDAAETMGVNTLKIQMVAMIISAGMTAIGGTIYAQYLLYIDPDCTFGMIYSIEIMLRPIIGGPGTVLGPLLGSFVLTPLAEVTRLLFQSYSGVYLMFYGLLLVIVIMFLPDGLMGMMRRFLFKSR